MSRRRAVMFKARFVRFQDQNEPGLYLVHPQNEGAPCDVEIIFVHGLMGKPTKTWQHPETGCVFFRDLLPQQMREQLPNGRARIWSYGYPADVGFQTSQIYDFALSLLQEVRDIRNGCGGRRIIWVCHSLGGIIVKRALNEACGQAQYIDIFRATIGITFLGTPHQGSGTATIGQIAAGVAGAFVPGAQILNRGLLRNLERNSTTLFETSNRFASICSKFKIYTFYESRPLMGGRVVVTRSSAVLNLPNETARELNATHQSICRFKDRSDQNWRPVLNSILGMVSMTVRPSPGTVPARSPPLAGIGNQRQPQPPYPQSSSSQQHQPYTGGAYSQAPTIQAPAPQYQSSTAPGPYMEQYYGQYARPTTGWSAELPEMTRRPVPSPNPSVQSNPPRPPKVPLPGESASFPTPHSSSSYVQPIGPSISQPNLSIEPEHRERRPYSSFNTSYAREAVSPIPFTSRPTPSPQPAPSVTHIPTPQATPSVDRSPTPQAIPPVTTSPAPSSTSTTPSAPPNAEAEDVPENSEVGAMCDACLNNIYCSQHRFQCTECYDYDLCLSCFRSGRESKSHKRSHAVRHILKTVALKPDDFIPPHDDVNPMTSADELKTFITLEPDVNRPESEARWHFLHGTDSHLRYLTATVEPGHYAAHITILPRLSNTLSQAGRDELKEEGLGYLRIGLGTLRNKKQFFRTRYQEESFASLVLEEGQIIDKLLDRYWWTVVKLPGDGEPVSLHADCVFSIETPEDLGLIVQWSGIRAFASGNEATVSINIADIRLYDIRDFAEPLKVPPEQPPSSTQPPTVVATPAPEASVPTPSNQAEDTGDEEITAEELLSALLQIQQSVEDARQRAQLEAAIKQRLKQQEEERQNAVFTYMFAKAIEKQAILEQEQREQEEARRFLRLMGFDF